MSNILEILAILDLLSLQEIADELDGVLSHIGYAEGAEDINYIKEVQEYFKKKVCKDN